MQPTAPGVREPDPTALPDEPAERVRRGLVVGLIIAGVLTQISYPLLSGAPLRAVTVISVLLLTSAGLLHAALRWSAGHAALLLAVAGGIGLAAEAVGVATGYPFGDYLYTGRLGLQVVSVPVLVPIAWTMIAYPALLLGRRLAARPDGSTSRARTVLLGGFTLAAWDLYLDPQMIAQDAWRFADPHPALPGVPGIPLTNYAGWLLVALVIVAALDLALPARPRHRPAWEWPAASVLAWTWLGSAVANLFFFGRPWVALYGGLVMGLTVLPYLRRLVSEARAEARAVRPARAAEARTGAEHGTTARNGDEQ
ncbi:carotenoid biosynthesis protein [Kineosporia succinea]|uniref:Membrane protein n=1 Tax=Kineosporia succinea TaxID=84632 RepID=A0ABT9P6H5_9ACTN|nr:carotenoid biosynthesis protein [Kineosporia succinea]MDP9828281.1 putative membrane protein [Kineosporia succinea]